MTSQAGTEDAVAGPVPAAEARSARIGQPAQADGLIKLDRRRKVIAAGMRVPFVPLGSTTLDDCITLARAFGERVANRFALPVYLYARAATRPERVRLADVRKGGYEGVRDDLAARVAERAPDFGPSCGR